MALCVSPKSFAEKSTFCFCLIYLLFFLFFFKIMFININTFMFINMKYYMKTTSRTIGHRKLNIEIRLFLNNFLCFSIRGACPLIHQSIGGWWSKYVIRSCDSLDIRSSLYVHLLGCWPCWQQSCTTRQDWTHTICHQVW